MSEKITAVKLKENISKNPFYSCPGGGTFELNSFHLAGHLTSDLVPGAGHLTNNDFKSSNARGLPGGGCWSFKLIDTLISRISNFWWIQSSKNQSISVERASKEYDIYYFWWQKAKNSWIYSFVKFRNFTDICILGFVNLPPNIHFSVKNGDFAW